MLSGERAQGDARALAPMMDRAAWITSAVTIVLAILAWGSVFADTAMAGMSTMTPGMSMMAASVYVLAWGIMMAAMMLPSAAPMIVLYGAIHRNADRTGQRGIATLVFVALYVLIWMAFGLPIYLADQLVGLATATSPTLRSLVPYGVAAVIILAGLFQFSPMKVACLRACQSPLGFLMAQWRDGYLGTIRLGVAHAAYCIGCCWALMVVLVAAGAMSLNWVLLITAVVAVEKMVPAGIWVARGIGIVLVMLGVAMIVEPALYFTLSSSGMSGATMSQAGM